MLTLLYGTPRRRLWRSEDISTTVTELYHPRTMSVLAEKAACSFYRDGSVSLMDSALESVLRLRGVPRAASSFFYRLASSLLRWQ